MFHQGSVFDPVLFIIFTNDMCRLETYMTTCITLKLFADAANTVISFDDIQRCLNAPISWSESQHLTLSHSKCAVINRSPERTKLKPSYQYTLNSILLTAINFQTGPSITYDSCGSG